MVYQHDMKTIKTQYNITSHTSKDKIHPTKWAYKWYP